MRKLFSGLLIGGAVAFAGSPVGAAPTAATGVMVLLLGTLPPVFVPGSGTYDPVTGALSANFFAGSGSSPVTGNAPITQIFFSVGGNASGVIGSGPVVSGTLQARGFGIGAALAGAPLTNKLGFASATTAVHSAASATVTAHFGKWTTGVTTAVRSHTGMTAACAPMGTVCPTGMLGGATANSAIFAGTASLVYVAQTDLWSSLANGIPTFTVMGLNFAPEPGSMLLIGAALATVGVLGRRRMR